MAEGGFEHLIAPTSFDAFFEQHWESRPLRTERHDPRYFDGIITTAAIDRLFESRQHGAEFIKVIADGREVHQGVWAEPIALKDGRTVQVADFAKVLDEFHRGASIVINGAHRSIPELRTLCDRLKDELGLDLQANIYITPSESRAFKPHYDLHDAFLLQIAGRKCWRMYRRVADYPVEQTGTDLEAVESDAPQEEFVLEQGDALYIPSGYVHAAATSERASVHVTLGLKPKRRYELLEDLLEAAKAEPELRKALPLKVFSKERQAEEWARTLESLDAIWARFRAHPEGNVHASKQDRRQGASLTDAIDIDEIDASTVVRLLADVEIEPRADQSEISLSAGAHRVTVARIFEPTIVGLLTKKPVTVGELGGLLTDAGKVEFAQTLARAGLLEIVRD